MNILSTWNIFGPGSIHGRVPCEVELEMNPCPNCEKVFVLKSTLRRHHSHAHVRVEMPGDLPSIRLIPDYFLTG